MRVPLGTMRSIGEVLAVLKADFPDITISKIRFLEGQGLVTPQRTPSGYRKFSDDDVARLRFILRQQKEHFLPLKVIKDRLEATEPSDGDGQDAAADEPGGSLAGGGYTGMVLSRSDLLEAAELTEGQLRELEGFGLIQGQRSGASVWYDEDVCGVARLAGQFLKFGVEPRHLRVFKTSAEREADLYRQIAGPVLGSRNTQARMDAVARLAELCTIGEAMRAELLRQALQK